jgi:tetratricopeptide (TPR) repeat protein
MHSITMNGVDSSPRCCTSANQAGIIAAVFVQLMSDPLRTDQSRAHDAAPTHDRDAKIEQLLLLGLDYYFAARYELAINVWTRALFLDRSHARARAYIERARSALAERQRESEELLQNGLAAFHRGEPDEARRLLQAAIDGGAPTDEALAVLERLNLLEARVQTSIVLPPGDTERRRGPVVSAAIVPSVSGLTIGSLMALIAIAGGGYAAWNGRVGWSSFVALARTAGRTEPPAARAAQPVARDTTLPVPRRGEETLARGKALAAGGHLREALTALDQVRSTDPQKAEADRLRGEIQRQLLTLSPVTAVSQPNGARGERRKP